jgi:transglutaminase-like putative cysteine protease
MKYKIAHLTTYDYSEMVPFCQNEVHLAPRNHPGQTCRYHRLIVRPTPASSSKRFDYFGNPVNYFAIHEGHRRLMVSAVSKIDLHPRPLPDPSQTPPWETVRDRLTLDHSVIGLEAYQFCFDSPLVRHSPIMEQYALESFPAGRPILAALQDLTSRIFHDFQYDPEATTVKTPLEESSRSGAASARIWRTSRSPASGRSGWRHGMSAGTSARCRRQASPGWSAPMHLMPGLRCIVAVPAGSTPTPPIMCSRFGIM